MPHDCASVHRSFASQGSSSSIQLSPCAWYRKPSHAPWPVSVTYRVQRRSKSCLDPVDIRCGAGISDLLIAELHGGSGTRRIGRLGCRSCLPFPARLSARLAGRNDHCAILSCPFLTKVSKSDKWRGSCKRDGPGRQLRGRTNHIFLSPGLAPSLVKRRESGPCPVECPTSPQGRSC